MIDERLYLQITDRHSVTITCVGGGDGRLPVASASQRSAAAGSSTPDPLAAAAPAHHGLRWAI